MKQTPIWKILMKLCPPVMLALLIQSIYNIVDSYFVSRYSPEGLTALSIVFPIQLLMTAIATGTGAGINILVSRMDGEGNAKSQSDIMKNGLFLGFINFFIFAVIGLLCIRAYCNFSSGQALVRNYGVQYSSVIFIFSLGMFLEANCTKILQAKGNMILPMCAQILGAVINVVLDPILIFGLFGFPAMGIQGAAAATVIGQWGAMILVLVSVLSRYSVKGTLSLKNCLKIYQTGLAPIVMQSLYTLYIIGLNLILKQFTENAVTVLGIYYKLQTFFFIPLMGLQQVILPVISFNYGAQEYGRVKQTLRCSIGISLAVMILGCAVFMTVPTHLLSIFSKQAEILEIGASALRIISVSFIPAAFVMMLTIYFQGIDKGLSSICVTILRQIILLVPLAWLFHFKGLFYVWFTFPVTEFIALAYCIWLYRKDRCKAADTAPRSTVLQTQ